MAEDFSSGHYNIPDDANKARRTRENWEARLLAKAKNMAFTRGTPNQYPSIYNRLLASYDGFISFTDHPVTPPSSINTVVVNGIQVVAEGEQVIVS